MAWAALIHNRECPSVLRATASEAMMPLAPARDSTTTGLPRAWPSLSASRRATRSELPPAANGRTMRNGRVGQVAAHVLSGNAKALTTRVLRFNMRCMVSTPIADGGAAIDHQVVSGHKGPGGAGQHGDHAGHFLGFSCAPQRGGLDAPGHEGFIGHELLGQRRADEAG